MNSLIKEHLIKKFIEEHNRTPSKIELNFLIRNFKEENPLVDKEGLSANEKDSYCNANSESSATKYNKFWGKSFLDFDYLIKEFEEKKETQRNIFVDRLRNLKSFKKEYKSLEKKINFSILNFQSEDIFSYEIVEDFKDLSKVDLEKSNIYHLDNEKITINVSRTEAFSVDISELSYRIRHRKGNKESETATGSISNVLTEDAKFFRIESRSNIPDDIVEFIIDLDFKLAKELNELKYVTVAEESNSKLMQDCYYSLNGADYIHVEPEGNSVRVAEDRNLISFNNIDSSIKQKIKSVRLVLRKTSYDYEKEGKFYYNFGLDFIGYLNRKYNLNRASVMYSKAYEVLNEEGAPYNFGIAKIDKGTCCEIPDLTSVDIYLSKDNINFIKADFNKTENTVVQFNDNWGNVKSFEDFDLIDLESKNDFLIDQNIESLNLNEDLKMFNIYLKKENKDKVLLKSLKMKRNVLSKSKNSSQQGVYTGWIAEGNFYKCVFKCNSPEGRIIDFGNNNVYLDEKLTNGKTFIKYGTHKIKVNNSFFNESINEKEVMSVRQLRTKISDYPYNPRYLIEGFEYNSKFKGEKIFNGFSDQRGSDLKRVTLNELNENLEAYSVIENEENIYFVIKQIDSLGIQEDYDITYRKSTPEDGNLLFIKAILKTEDPRRAPKIDKIQVRVL